MQLREERAEDRAAIRQLLVEAFGGEAEASLVDALRGDGDVAIGLVAERAGAVIGYVALSPLKSPPHALALAPVAVRPKHQREGIGSALIDEALRRSRAGGWRMIFVVGEPEYYERFGFSAAAASDFPCPYAGSYFMALKLSTTPVAASPVVYSDRFAAL